MQFFPRPFHGEACRCVSYSPRSDFMRQRPSVRVQVPAAVLGLAACGAALAVAIALDAHNAVLVAGALAFTGVAIALVLGHRAMASRGLAALERRVTSLTRGDRAEPAPSRDPAVSRLDGALSGLAASLRLRQAEITDQAVDRD